MRFLKTIVLATALGGGCALAFAEGVGLPPSPRTPPGGLPAAQQPPTPAAAATAEPNGASESAVIPAGQVLVKIQNASVAPLDIFVDPPNAGPPVFIMTLEPEYEALQPTPIG